MLTILLSFKLFLYNNSLSERSWFGFTHALLFFDCKGLHFVDEFIPIVEVFEQFISNGKRILCAPKIGYFKHSILPKCRHYWVMLCTDRRQGFQAH